jgi:hypothetical protein
MIYYQAKPLDTAMASGDSNKTKKITEKTLLIGASWFLLHGQVYSQVILPLIVNAPDTMTRKQLLSIQAGFGLSNMIKKKLGFD